MSPVMSHHLTKLHKKALAAGNNSSSLLLQASTNSSITMAGDLMTSLAGQLSLFFCTLFHSQINGKYDISKTLTVIITLHLLI